MDKAGIIVGGILGVTTILVAFTVFFGSMSTEPSLPNEIIVSNGHGINTVGQSTPLQLAKKLSLVEIFERTESGTVRVEIKTNNQILETNSVGSGFVFDKKGHIITNAHVINNAEKIIITFLDGRSYIAKVIGEDLFTDIAVIKVNVDEELLNPISLGDSSNLKVGESIAAIGNPFGLSGSMTSGIVSQLNRLLPAQYSVFQIPDVIQTDAAINPGNSGGPLLNLRGEVVGINTAIQSGTGEFTGIGFAIPSQTIAKIVPSLIKDGQYLHPWIGITGRDIDPDLATALNLNEAKGFLVITVVEDSPAQKAGLRGSEQKNIDDTSYPVNGDIIISVDGIDVRKINDILIHLQRQKSVGDRLIMEVLRDDRIINFVLILEERPSFIQK